MRILEFSDGYTSASAPTTTGITRSSLADGTAYRILANNSSGVMSENAALTAGRVVYPDANGQLTGSANFSYSAGALTIKLAGSSTPTNALIINETTGLNGNITGIEFNSAGTGNAGRALISQKIAPGGATAGIRVYTGGATPVQAIEVSGTDQSTTFSGKVSVNGGTLSSARVAAFDLNQNASSYLYVTNSNAGSGAEAGLEFGSNSVTTRLVSSSTAGGAATYLYGDGAGGLYLQARNASGPVVIASGNATALTFNTSQNATFSGSVSAASGAFSGAVAITSGGATLGNVGGAAATSNTSKLILGGINFRNGSDGNYGWLELSSTTQRTGSDRNWVIANNNSAAGELAIYVGASAGASPTINSASPDSAKFRINSAGDVGIGTAPVTGYAITAGSRATFNSMTIGDSGALGTGSRIENPNGLEFRPASSGGSTLQLTTTRIVQIGGSSLDDSLTYIKWNGTSVSIANNGTRTYVFPGGTCGLLMVSNANNSQGAVFMVSGGTGATSIVEIADPSGNFTTTAANAGTNNVYQSTNGTITVENKTGGSCNYKLSFMQVN